MKSRGLFLIIFALLFSHAVAQESKSVIIPGKGHVDVEQLNKPIDMNRDISQLNITELRILRNSIYAREGWAFDDAFLRGVFLNTSWYNDKMWKRWEQEEEGKPTPVQPTKEEQEFMNRLLTREKELMKENFHPQTAGHRVNLNNVVNAMQLEQFDNRLREKLGRNGFAIVPADHEQLFHLYEKNDYCNFPNFVTTDLYLQLYHMYFDCLLREVEEAKFSNAVKLLCQRGVELTKTCTTPELDRLHTFFLVGNSLIQGNCKGQGTQQSPFIKEEYDRCMASEDGLSEYLGYLDAVYPYSLYRPRGHYTRNDTLKRYFRAMMWLQTAPFASDKPEQLNAAIVLSELVSTDAKLAELYRQLSEPFTWLFGTPDNVTILQVGELLKQTGMTADQILKKKKPLQKLREAIEQLSLEQTRIKPKFQYSSPCKINLLPQRYMPDAEVLQEMVDYDNKPTQRATPMGLDVFAAMGVASAERILLDELKEGQRWSGFADALTAMKQRMQQIDWQQTVSTRWIQTASTLTEKPQNAPYFMLTPEWQKKDLNAALASWAELKHDAILYAKQPFGAECGGGGPPEPTVKGYVEPNVAFWQKAIDLLDATAGVLNKYNLTTEKAKKATERLKEEAQFLLNVSKKELSGKPLSKVEYGQIECIGATIENITLDLLSAPNEQLYYWTAVEGADRKVALIADVYTANSANNPKKCILYAGVGMADEIYTIVEVDGYLYLMRGAVLSYRETTRGLDQQRMTDEEWQKHIETYTDEGRPSWMKDIIVPMKEAPKANEKYFYSTGC